MEIVRTLAKGLSNIPTFTANLAGRLLVRSGIFVRAANPHSPKQKKPSHDSESPILTDIFSSA
jgi:hypothetical protein